MKNTKNACNLFYSQRWWTWQRSVRIRTEANFGQMRTGSDWILRIGGSGLGRSEKSCCFNAIILTLSKFFDLSRF